MNFSIFNNIFNNVKFPRLDDLTKNVAAAAAGLTLMTSLAGAAQNFDASRANVRAAAHAPADAPVDRDEKPIVAPPQSPLEAAIAPAEQERGQVPDRRELVPGTPQGAQSRFTPSAEQMANAERIVKVAKDRGLPDRAAVIAVATALQESKLHNLGHLGERNDHDSQGLFQQRPSSGWGTVEQITNPEYAANAFYEALEQVPGWQEMPLTEAAQTVQVSAYPDAYAQWEEMAADIVLATYDTGPYADIK